MSRIALACAVLLASLFTVSGQADAGYRGHKPYVVKHYHAKKKFNTYKRHRRWYLKRGRNHRWKQRHRRGKHHRYVRRYR